MGQFAPFVQPISHTEHGRQIAHAILGRGEQCPVRGIEAMSARELPKRVRRVVARVEREQDEARSVPERGREVLPAPSVPERDGDRALGLALPHDVAVELGHDLDGSQLPSVGPAGHSSSTVTWSLV